MGSNQKQTTITLEQVTLIAEALSAWQQTWLCRNPDLTHMSDEEVTRARMKASERARPALELLADLHSECFRANPGPAQARAPDRGASPAGLGEPVKPDMHSGKMGRG